MVFTRNNKTSSLPEAKLRWIKTFSFFTMLLFVTLFIQKISGFTFNIDLNAINNTILATTLITAGYITFFRPSVLFEVKIRECNTTVIPDDIYVEEELCRTNTNNLPESKIIEYSDLIEDALKEKPFLKKGFVIRDLAELSGIPVHHLSHFINSHYNLHFQDFINKKRIEHLILQLNDKEWQSLSLEGQAWAVGFKSRTTFFRAFTKLMGMSPSEYFNSLNEKKSKIRNYPATA